MKSTSPSEESLVADFQAKCLKGTLKGHFDHLAAPHTNITKVIRKYM